jgi:Spy/CpxP family protein refolding chaperone
MSPKFKPWLLLGGIFVIGVVTGSALTIGLGPHFMHGSGERDMRKHWMAHLTAELNLTADQQAKIQPILADAEGKIQALRHEQVEHGYEIFKAADEQISALLTPDQKVELQKMEAEREKMFAGHMHPPGSMFNHDGPDDRMPPPPPAPSGSPGNPAPPPP